MVDSTIWKKISGSDTRVALALVFMGMFAITGAFELVQFMVLSPAGVWEVSLLTIIVASASAAFIAYFPIRSLRSTEARLDTLLTGSPLPQFVIDAEHRIISWNRALEISTGIQASEMYGTTNAWSAFYAAQRPTLADLLVDGDIEKLPDWYAGHIRKSELMDGSYEAVDFFPHVGNDGMWFYFTAIPVRDENGVLLGAVESFIDVTGRKRAEAALKESEDRFLAFIKEAAMRLKNPLEVVEGNLGCMIGDIERGEVVRQDLKLQLTLQIKNLEQIRTNIIELNKAIVDRSGEISDAAKKFLTE